MARRLTYLGLTLYALTQLSLSFGMMAMGGEQILFGAVGVLLSLVVFAVRGLVCRLFFGKPEVPQVGGDGLMEAVVGGYGAYLVLMSLPSAVGNLVGWGTTGLSMFRGVVYPDLIFGGVLIVWMGFAVRRASREPVQAWIRVHDLAHAAVILTALPLLLQVVQLGMFFYYSTAATLAGAVTWGVTVVATACLLFVFRRRLVDAVLGASGPASPLPGLATLWATTLAVIGLFHLMLSIQGVVGPYLAEKLPREWNPLEEDPVSGLDVAGWTRIGLALVLVFEGKRLAGFWVGKRLAVS